MCGAEILSLVRTQFWSVLEGAYTGHQETEFHVFFGHLLALALDQLLSISASSIELCAWHIGNAHKLLVLLYLTHSIFLNGPSGLFWASHSLSLPSSSQALCVASYTR